MEGVFLSLWETNAAMYERLEERVVGELAWDMNRFCVRTGLVERESFEKLRTSPYRNYVNRIYFRDCPILYLAGIERTERVEELYRALEAEGLLERVRARIDLAAGFPGYSYIRIYDRASSRQAMLERLKADLGIGKSVLLTSREGCGDVMVHGGVNEAVKRLERLYEPYPWQRK